jgi:hypothetical protein
MSKFYVGQRVRKIWVERPIYLVGVSRVRVPDGALGTVTKVLDQGAVVLFDGIRSDHESGAFSGHHARLAPIDDNPGDLANWSDIADIWQPALAKVPAQVREVAK